MRFDSDTRTRLIVTMTTDFDPTGTTIDVEVDGTWYAATWIGPPTQKVGKWTHVARTTGYFAGPDVATPNGAVVLALGRHLTQTRITSGGDILAENSTPIDVA